MRSKFGSSRVCRQPAAYTDPATAGLFRRARIALTRSVELAEAPPELPAVPMTSHRPSTAIAIRPSPSNSQTPVEVDLARHPAPNPPLLHSDPAAEVIAPRIASASQLAFAS